MKDKPEIILITLDASLMGGVERVVSNLSSIFSCNGHRVIVYSIFKKNKDPFYPFEKVKYLSNNISDNSIRSKIITLFYLLKLVVSLKSGIRHKYVISTFPRISIILAAMPKIISSRCIASEHSAYNMHPSIIRWLRILLYNRMYATVTLTMHDKELFYNNGVSVEMIPNPLTVLKKVKKNHNKSSFTCLSLGRLHKHKGFDRLLDIAKVLKHQGILFKIVGSGVEEKNLRNIIDKYDLDDYVKLYPETRHVEDFINECDVYLMTSITEAFPMVLIEAASLGKPIIAYDSPPCVHEIIKHGKNGYLINDGDAIQFANKIKLLKREKSIYSNMSIEAEHSIIKYNYDNIYETWMKLLI
jgi:glycosyltransferase involved in cell wall biosynthesis